MIVIADTSPVNYLVLIGYEFVLPQLYGEVMIPDAVFRELIDADAPGIVRRWIATPPKWVLIRDEEESDALIGSLDRGESAGILLAERLRADLIILDDAAARHEAERRGLNITETLGVLQTAARDGLLDLADAMGKLSQTNFHVAPELFNRLLGGQ